MMRDSGFLTGSVFQMVFSKCKKTISAWKKGKTLRVKQKKRVAKTAKKNKAKLKRKDVRTNARDSKMDIGDAQVGNMPVEAPTLAPMSA